MRADSAQCHDIRMALPTIDRLRVRQPVLQIKRLSADKGYDSNKLAQSLLDRGIEPYLVPRRFKHRTRQILKRSVGRPPDQRWKIERTHAWCNQQRRIASFYEKKRSTYEAFLLLACIRFYLRRLHNNQLK